MEMGASFWTPVHGSIQTRGVGEPVARAPLGEMKTVCVVIRVPLQQAHGLYTTVPWLHPSSHPHVPTAGRALSQQQQDRQKP